VDASAPLTGAAFRLLGALAIPVAVVLTRGRSTVDRRVTVLVAAGLLPNLAVSLRAV
jgi:hypothetical protein